MVEKPAGILSQGAAGARGENLVDYARDHYQDARIGVLHRIDRNVSGLVVIVRTPEAARVLSMDLAGGRIERRYLAVVRGRPAEESFVLDAMLSKNERTNEVTALDKNSVQALAPDEREMFKEARTEVRVLKKLNAPLGRLSILEATPITGRSHQIRAHLALAKLPIIGDPKYGIRARKIDRPLLHAHALRFTHPISGEPVALHSTPPWEENDLVRLRGLQG